jgi:hypothetical protein
VDLRGKWVLKGAPALVDSTSPRYGEKASDYAAVCDAPRREGGSRMSTDGSAGADAAGPSPGGRTGWTDPTTRGPRQIVALLGVVVLLALFAFRVVGG